MPLNSATPTPAPDPLRFDRDRERLLDAMSRTIDRFLDDPGPSETSDQTWIPALDVSESDREFTIRIEAPGVADDALDIRLAGRSVTIAGRMAESNEPRTHIVHRRERRCGAFRRSVTLPHDAEPGAITAESDKGVVTIHVAKRLDAASLRIPLRAPGGALTMGS